MREISEIQKKIQETLIEIESLKKIHTHLSEVENKLSLAYKKLNSADKQINKELSDIEKLEETGVKSLFYKVLGSKEEQLEMERQQYLEASLKFKEIKNSVELLEYEKEILLKKSGNIDLLNKTLNNLKIRRENEIFSSNDLNLRSELKKILDDIDFCTRLDKELKEALIEGEKSIKMLSTVIQHLRSAGDWGHWDGRQTTSRRGAFSKHRAIDMAVKNISQTQFQLDIFSKELSDLGENHYNFKLPKNQFNGMTDFFFDNLISDWIMQQKIKSTLNNLLGINDHVNRIVLTLKKESEENIKKYESLELLKDEFLLS